MGSVIVTACLIGASIEPLVPEGDGLRDARSAAVSVVAADGRWCCAGFDDEELAHHSLVLVE